MKVEVARTPVERAEGLMNRPSLDKGSGMIFIFEEEDVQSFWMKNTLIPLDMIFISSGMEVVGVVENAEPLTTTPRRVDAPSQFVLEVEGGFAARHGVGAGTKVVFAGFEHPGGT